MDYYVLQVPTGSEEHVRDGLEAKGFCAFSPSEIVPLRRGGVWRDEERVLLPGYVFVGLAALDAQVWHSVMTAARFLCGHARFLGTPEPQPITAAEAQMLRFLAADGAPLAPSVVEFDRFGTPRILAGPLLQRAGCVERFERRQRRARVHLTLLGEAHEISMGIVPVCAQTDDESEVAACALAERRSAGTV